MGRVIKVLFFYILILVFVVPILVLFFLGNLSRKDNQKQDISVSISETTPTPKPQELETTPFLSKEDFVRKFCNFIDEGKIVEAIGMMDVQEETAKQIWGVVFNNFSSFKLTKIKESSLDKSGNSFEVEIEVSLKKNLADLPIPNYGWENGVNKRWINLVDFGGGVYKIKEISTGP